jgi:arylsulfatase A-like enzyme
MRVDSLLMFLVAGGLRMLKAAVQQPNIVFILADDLGYNELGFMNSTRGLITPHLDGLAASGVVLRNYYVQPICSPTRSALLTGRYTTRLGTQSSVIYWDTPWGLSLNETLIPQNLQDAGYITAMFGKWHLGMFTQAYTPPHRGFDEHMGYYQGCQAAYTHVAACCGASSPDHDQNNTCGTSGRYLGYDWFKTGPVPHGGDSKPDLSANHINSAHLIRAAAVDFIRRAADQPKPFFLYLPFQNVHSPYTCDHKYRAMYTSQGTRFTGGEQTIFGYITEMDDAVGDVVAELKATGRFEHTIIIFSSDNGAPKAGEGVDHTQGSNPGWIARNHPFRGYKSLIWEGGTRVAGFVASPLLPAKVRGTESHELFHVTDWLPTIVNIAGGKTLRNLPLDGHDIWPTLADGGASPRSEMLYNINPLCNKGQAGSPRAGLRVGAFKVLAWCYNVKGIAGANETGPVNAPSGAGHDPEFEKGVVLYNLVADPGERTNLAHDPAHAVRLERMLTRLQELADEMVEPMQWDPPYQGHTYYCAECPKHPASKGVGVPWEPWLPAQHTAEPLNWI